LASFRCAALIIEADKNGWQSGDRLITPETCLPKQSSLLNQSPLKTVGFPANCRLRTGQASEGVVSDVNEFYFRILLQQALSNPESLTELPEQVRWVLKNFTRDQVEAYLKTHPNDLAQARYW
jgi:hypothetical protein